MEASILARETFELRPAPVVEKPTPTEPAVPRPFAFEYLKEMRPVPSVSDLVTPLASHLKGLPSSVVHPVKLVNDKAVAADVAEFVNPKPFTDEYQTLERFVFTSVGDVTEQEWTEIRVRLQGHVRKIAQQLHIDIDTAVISRHIVTSVREGRYAWPQEVQPNLLTHIFNIGRTLVCGVSAQKTAKYKQVKVNKRARKPLANPHDVIQHLPQIAVLVSRLNDLLSPIANPDGAKPESREVAPPKPSRRVRKIVNKGIPIIFKGREVLTSKLAAEFIEVSEEQLESWRLSSSPDGPAVTMNGCQPVYERSALESWLAERQQREFAVDWFDLAAKQMGGQLHA